MRNFVSVPCQRMLFFLRRQATAKRLCGSAVVFSYVCAGFVPRHCTMKQDFWANILGWVVRLLADNKPLLKCEENVDVANAMVQIISLRTKSAVWLFLLIGTFFIFELEYREIKRNVAPRESWNVVRRFWVARCFWGLWSWVCGWWDAFKEYLQTESMLQMLQNVSSFSLFPCAVSMAVCHAFQSGGIWWRNTIWLEYIISVCLTGCSM